MCSRKRYIKKNVTKEDKMVQTDNVFYMTEVEETMLTFIRIFKINIASLSTLCYGVVYNYSQKRYSIDTEQIETDSEDDEPRTMDVVDDLTVNKLIEESQKNKKLIYNVMKYKANNKILQSIKDRQKATPDTDLSGSTKKLESIGINPELSANNLDINEVGKIMPNITPTDFNHEMCDINLRSIQPVNPRNIILSKWSKDKQEQRKNRLSPLRLLDVQIIPPQKKQDEKKLQLQCKALLNHLPEKPISTSQNYPLPQNYQREHLKSCNFALPSHIMQFFDQSRSMQNVMTPPNQEQHNSSPQLSQCIDAEQYQPTGNTSNYQLVNDKTQMQQKLDYVIPTMIQPTALYNQVRETHVEYPIPLLKKGNLETFNERPKSVCNPRPGHEYSSPYTRAYYQPPPLDRIPFLPDDNLAFVDLTIADSSQTSQMRESENQMKHLQKQKMQQHLQCQRQQHQQQQQLQYQEQQQLQHQQQKQLQHYQQKLLQHQPQQPLQHHQQQQLQHHQQQQIQHQEQHQLQQQQLQHQHQQQLQYQNQQQLQQQQMLQQINQQQLDDNVYHHVDVLQNQTQRQQSSQLPPQPQPQTPYPQISLQQQYRPPAAAPEPLDSSMQTEILSIPPSYGNPISHTISNNSFPYINNIAANVQPVQIPLPLATIANQTQNQTASPGKDYSSRRTNHAKRNSLRYARNDLRPTASDMRVPEAPTQTSSNQMWPYPGQQYRYSTMNPRSNAAQPHTGPSPQDYQDRSAQYQQTSGWPQSTSYNPYETLRH